MFFSFVSQFVGRLRAGMQDASPSGGRSDGVPEDFSIDAESGEVEDHDTREVENAQYCPGFTPKVLEKKKRTIFVSLALILSGVILLIVGAVLITKSEQFSAGVALVVIGALCFIPGAYTSFILINVCRGNKGWHLNHIPD